MNRCQIATYFEEQCDQIWQKFATLVIFEYSSAIFEDLFSIWRNALCKISMILGNFHCWYFRLVPILYALVGRCR